MCIESSVGKDGTNNKVDVKVVQAALNLCTDDKFHITTKLPINGKLDANTISAIEAFQSTVVGATKPDGVVNKNGKTLQALKKKLKKGISNDSLLAIMAHGNSATIQTYLPIFKTEVVKYQADSPLRFAHFLAQVGHESLSLLYTEEIASGVAYEGRKDLGNTQQGDGKRFKGRGLIQLTGRKNYATYGEYACLNLLQSGNESMIAKVPAYAVDASLWFWKTHNLNKRADMDDLKGITRRVNGGYNGLDDRQMYLNRAKFFLTE